MIDQLYQDAILNHAKAAVGQGKLETPTGSAMVDNPLCGDRVTVDIALDGDRIAAVGDLHAHWHATHLCEQISNLQPSARGLPTATNRRHLDASAAARPALLLLTLEIGVSATHRK